MVLPAPIIPTSRMRGVILSRCPDRVDRLGRPRRPTADEGVVPSEAKKPSRLRTTSASESPPNLRSASVASTSAVIDLGHHPHGGHGGDVGALAEADRRLLGHDVDRLEHRPVSVASGFIATRATRSAPLEIPPSMPPALSVGRT